MDHSPLAQCITFCPSLSAAKKLFFSLLRSLFVSLREHMSHICRYVWDKAEMPCTFSSLYLGQVRNGNFYSLLAQCLRISPLYLVDPIQCDSRIHRFFASYFNILNNWEQNWQKSMATSLANEINATDKDVRDPTEQVQIMFPLKDKNIN